MAGALYALWGSRALASPSQLLAAMVTASFPSILLCILCSRFAINRSGTSYPLDHRGTSLRASPYHEPASNRESIVSELSGRLPSSAKSLPDSAKAQGTARCAGFEAGERRRALSPLRARSGGDVQVTLALPCRGVRDSAPGCRPGRRPAAASVAVQGLLGLDDAADGGECVCRRPRLLDGETGRAASRPERAVRPAPARSKSSASRTATPSQC